MAILSDVDIAKIWPRYSGRIESASVDLHLGDTLLWWPDYVRRDPRTDQSDRWKTVNLEQGVWVLEPGVRHLAATRETLTLPDDVAGQICARSSWGRDGLAVIQGPAGFLDPGFHGVIVLELSVVGSDLIVWPGASVAQVVFHQLSSPAGRPYSGRYQHQDGVVPSRLHLEVTP